MFFRELEKQSVKAVHDDDLDALLESLGVRSRFLNGEITCKFCRGIVTKENLHSLFPQSGDIKFVCDRRECVEELTSLLREGEVSL